MEIDERLTRCTIDNTPSFSLLGKQLVGRVLDIYDGDTLTVALPLSGGIYAMSCRLEGIDTCEMKSRTEFCKSTAYRARNRLIQLCTRRTSDDVPLDNRWPRRQVRQFLETNPSYVSVLCGEFDKYGRLLAGIVPHTSTSAGGTSGFSETLLSERLAYRYSGDTKYTEEQIQQLLTTITTP